MTMRLVNINLELDALELASLLRIHQKTGTVEDCTSTRELRYARYDPEKTMLSDEEVKVWA